MRKTIVVLSLLPLATALWPSSARAVECDRALSGVACGGGQPTIMFERSAFSDAVSPARMRVDKPLGNDHASARDSSFSGVLLAMADELSYRPAGRLPATRSAIVAGGAPDAHSAQGGVQTQAAIQPVGGSVRDRSGNASMNAAPQPGSAALLLAGFLGMFAVARRRISSILG